MNDEQIHTQINDTTNNPVAGYVYDERDGVNAISASPSDNPVLNNNNKSSTKNRISEYVLFGSALIVIVALITGIQSLGVVGVIAFFIYGFALVLGSATRSIVRSIKNGNVVFGTIGLVLTLVAFIYLFPFLFFFAYIVMLMLGFADPPEVNS